jgi:hypothetical protein
MQSHKNKKKDEEVDVWVVTRGGEKIGRDFEQVRAQGQKLEGKIRKATQPPPKFDVSQQKQFMCDAQRAIEEERAHKSCNTQHKDHSRRLRSMKKCNE